MPEPAAGPPPPPLPLTVPPDPNVNMPIEVMDEADTDEASPPFSLSVSDSPPESSTGPPPMESQPAGRRTLAMSSEDIQQASEEPPLPPREPATPTSPGSAPLLSLPDQPLPEPFDSLPTPEASSNHPLTTRQPWQSTPAVAYIEHHVKRSDRDQSSYQTLLRMCQCIWGVGNEVESRKMLYQPRAQFVAKLKGFLKTVYFGAKVFERGIDVKAMNAHGAAASLPPLTGSHRQELFDKLEEYRVTLDNLGSASIYAGEVWRLVVEHFQDKYNLLHELCAEEPDCGATDVLYIADKAWRILETMPTNALEPEMVIFRLRRKWHKAGKRYDRQQIEWGLEWRSEAQKKLDFTNKLWYETSFEHYPIAHYEELAIKLNQELDEQEASSSGLDRTKHTTVESYDPDQRSHRDRPPPQQRADLMAMRRHTIERIDAQRRARRAELARAGMVGGGPQEDIGDDAASCAVVTDSSKGSSDSEVLPEVVRHVDDNAEEQLNRRMGRPSLRVQTAQPAPSVTKSFGAVEDKIAHRGHHRATTVADLGYPTADRATDSPERPDPSFHGRATQHRRHGMQVPRTFTGSVSSVEEALRRLRNAETPEDQPGLSPGDSLIIRDFAATPQSSAPLSPSPATLHFRHEALLGRDTDGLNTRDLAVTARLDVTPASSTSAAASPTNLLFRREAILSRDTEVQNRRINGTMVQSRRPSGQVRAQTVDGTTGGIQGWLDGDAASQRTVKSPPRPERKNTI